MITDGRSSNVERGLNATFSADVKLQLHIGATCIELGQVGPGFAILRKAQALPNTQAEIETIIDGHSTRWPIQITSEITDDSKRFEFEGVETQK